MAADGRNDLDPIGSGFSQGNSHRLQGVLQLGQPFYASSGQRRRQACTASSTTSKRPSFSTGTPWSSAQSAGVPGCKASPASDPEAVASHAATARVWGHPYALKRASFTTSSGDEQVEANPGVLSRGAGLAAHCGPVRPKRSSFDAGESARKRRDLAFHRSNRPYRRPRRS